MKRQVLYAVVVVTSIVASCSRPAAPPPSDAEAEPAVRAVDRNLQIVMTANDGSLDLESVCVGTVTPPSSLVKRGQKVRWHVTNDPFNPCPDLDKMQVTLKFDLPTMSDDLDEGSPPQVDVVWRNNKLERRVHKKQMVVPDSPPKRKYYVYYRAEKASPDPELDIQGDCGFSCGGDD